jgi:hypothetical protein
MRVFQDIIFLVPRGQVLLLGGIAEEDKWDTKENLISYQPYRDMLHRCQKFMPCLKSATIIEEEVRYSLIVFSISLFISIDRYSYYSFHKYLCLLLVLKVHNVFLHFFQSFISIPRNIHYRDICFCLHSRFAWVCDRHTRQV